MAAAPGAADPPPPPGAPPRAARPPPPAPAPPPLPPRAPPACLAGSVACRVRPSGFHSRPSSGARSRGETLEHHSLHLGTSGGRVLRQDIRSGYDGDTGLRHGPPRRHL